MRAVDDLATKRSTLGIWTVVAAALLALASTAPAQRFGFPHRMLPPDADGTRAVALGDVDGDGDLDAFVGNFARQHRLHLNGGTGNFLDVTSTSLPVLLDSTQAVA
ncbi:MAG TPA: FG-GAP-like repeat-containing protein, partial [Planctomycetota bacterium]|nr:FG-GAP-like repeat-containing protein [Planctomycetota bacterium]